jgi:hypothetical protein
MPKNNRIVVNLNHCQYAWKSWVTIDGNFKRDLKPESPTVHGYEFDCDAPAYTLIGDPHMTLLERARSLHIIDVWVLCVTFQVSANHRLTYIGEKAESLWKAWNEKIFNKKKGNK